MSDRSDELRRQRELVRQHLAWLDSEIAAQDGTPPADLPPRISQEHFSVTASDTDRDAELILAQFRKSSPAVEAQTKRGCLLYFAVAVVLLLAVALGFAYHYAKSRR